MRAGHTNVQEVGGWVQESKKYCSHCMEQPGTHFRYSYRLRVPTEEFQETLLCWVIMNEYINGVNVHKKAGNVRKKGRTTK